MTFFKSLYQNNRFLGNSEPIKILKAESKSDHRACKHRLFNSLKRKGILSTLPRIHSRLE